MPLISTKSLTIVIGITLCSISSYLLYILLKKDKDDDYESTLPRNNATSKKASLRIPKDTVGFVIGKKGAKVKQIQEQTNTHIQFRDSDKFDEIICTIEGNDEGCSMAQSLIKDLIKNQPVITSDDIWVAQNFIGKLIGRCGENINEISNITGAKINVVDGDRTKPTRRVNIKGTKEQIKLTISYIEELIVKYQQDQSKIEASLAKREPRVPSKNLDSPKSSPSTPKSEKLSGQAEAPFEVYVSAMIDPSRFWVQIVSPKAAELDLLVDDMTEYYNKVNNREAHVLHTVEVGDLVASTFQYDKRWYRAEVLKLVDDNLMEPKAELYYADYGDTDTVPCKDLYELPSNYLTLHFQAIECFLGQIQPIGESWSEEAIDKFEEWTHVAQWQKLSAKISGYSSRERTRARRSGSPVPGVDLYDVGADGDDLDIAEALVKHGYAVYKNKDEGRSTSRASSSGAGAGDVS